MLFLIGALELRFCLRFLFIVACVETCADLLNTPRGSKHNTHEVLLLVTRSVAAHLNGSLALLALHLRVINVRWQVRALLNLLHDRVVIVLTQLVELVGGGGGAACMVILRHLLLVPLLASRLVHSLSRSIVLELRPDFNVRGQHCRPSLLVSQ